MSDTTNSEPTLDEQIDYMQCAGKTNMDWAIEQSLKRWKNHGYAPTGYIGLAEHARVCAENHALRAALESLAERPNGYHDCSDYERGYGDAWAAKANMARVALKNLETASTNHQD